MTLVFAVPPFPYFCLNDVKLAEKVGKMGVTSQIKVNPTKVRDLLGHPVQGDPSRWPKHPVDFQKKFRIGLVRPGQARLKRNFCFEVNRRFWPT